MDRLIEYFFNVEVMIEYLPPMIDGFFVTLRLAALIVLLGISGGLALAMIRVFQLRPVNWLIVFFVDMFRALPPLVIIIVAYFALPYAGVQLSPFNSALLSLTLVLVAFSEEIFWAGILATDRGQWEAARSTGLTFFQTLTHVIIPQAVRMTIPPLTNRTIAITKGTALASAIAVPEILDAASTAQALSANPSPLTMGAIAYLIIFAPLVTFSRWLETRFRWIR